MAAVLPLLILLGIGGAFAYRGWWIYESLIYAFGFLVGVIIGTGFVALADVQGLMGLVFIIGAGAIGASLAMIAEILAVALTGYVFGAAVGSIVPGVTFGDWTHPVILLTGLGGALLAWLVHKFVIIMLTAFIGSIFISKTLVAWPNLGIWMFIRANAFSGWFFLAFLTGIMAQIGMLEYQEDETVIPDWYRSDSKGEVEKVDCPSCGKFVEPNWEHCQYCGEVLGSRTAITQGDESRLEAPLSGFEGDNENEFRCQTCNRVVERNWNNCQYCGTTLHTG